MNFSLWHSNRGKIFDSYDDRWFEYSFLKPKGLDRAVEKALTSLWNPMKSRKVLDVGCGSGRFLKWLDGLGHQVSGVDASMELIKKARKRLPERVQVSQCDAVSLPFDDFHFDVVFFVFSLEFMAQPAKALMEGLRIAKEAVFVVSLNFYSPLFWRDKILAMATRNPLLACCPLSSYKTKKLLSAYPDRMLRLESHTIWKNRLIFDEYIAPVVLIKIEKAIRAETRIPVSVPEKGMIISNIATFQKSYKKEVGKHEGSYAL